MAGDELLTVDNHHPKDKLTMAGVGEDVISYRKNPFMLSETQFPEIEPSSTAVIFGNYGDGNVGDEAMLDVLLDMLAWRQVKKVIVPSRAPENLKKIHQNVLLHPVGIIRGALSALSSDVLIIGGGTLFSHFSGKGIYPMLVVSILRKLFTRRKTIFYGIGYSSSTPEPLSKLAARAFNMSDGVYVRDSLSYKLLSQIVKGDKLFLGRELAFLLQSKPDVVLPDSFKDKRARHRVLVGFSLLYTFSEHDRKMIESVAEFISRISAKAGDDDNGDGNDAGYVFLTLNPAFIDKQGVRRSDEKVGEEVVRRLLSENGNDDNNNKDKDKDNDIASRCAVLPVYPPQTTLEMIGQLDYVISMRYHCLVFAHMKNKPYIAISFEDKHKAFVKDFGGEIIDFEQELSADSLVQAWEKIYK